MSTLSIRDMLTIGNIRMEDERIYRHINHQLHRNTCAIRGNFVFMILEIKKIPPRPQVYRSRPLNIIGTRRTVSVKRLVVSTVQRVSVSFQFQVTWKCDSNRSVFARDTLFRDLSTYIPIDYHGPFS